MTEAEYHSHPAMSQSKLKLLLENPRQFYLEHVLFIKQDKPTPSKNLGTCLDLALTDPEAYAKLEVKNTKTTSVEGYITENWKRQIDIWMESLNNYKMEDSFFGGLTFGEITATCTKQDMIFYSYAGIDWRMKTDYLNRKAGFFIDLKSTKAVTRDEFIKDCFNYDYHIQAASYANGIKIADKLSYLPRAYYVAVSTKTGEIFAFECSDQVIQLGMLEIERGCEIYKRNLETNDWARDKPLSILTAPEWQENQILSNYNQFFGVSK
ncbi:MAG: hypothetical protein E6Q33_02630 [Neisseriales bacterium]|nr:MAG: hypothetical protein E6Q33_02630 [Neisseriales bacterium]